MADPEVDTTIKSKSRTPKHTRPIVFIPGYGGSALGLKQPDNSVQLCWPPIGVAIKGSLRGFEANSDKKVVTGLIPLAYQPLIDWLHQEGY